MKQVIYKQPTDITPVDAGKNRSVMFYVSTPITKEGKKKRGWLRREREEMTVLGIGREKLAFSAHFGGAEALPTLVQAGFYAELVLSHGIPAEVHKVEVDYTESEWKFTVSEMYREEWLALQEVEEEEQQGFSTCSKDDDHERREEENES